MNRPEYTWTEVAVSQRVWPAIQRPYLVELRCGVLGPRRRLSAHPTARAANAAADRHARSYNLPVRHFGAGDHTTEGNDHA